MAEGAGGTPGKSATGQIKSDGTFELTTYKPDGAIIGMHEVFYMPTIAGEGGDEDEEGDATQPATPAAPAKPPGGKLLLCQRGGTTKIGVVEGSNDLKIELTNWAPKVEEEERERGE